ncbi:MAG: Mrp/NBP35 family ATP-binding protein [Alphaproteobacteria bacterium]|nr:Mrp/NBP35 family ATP-binding protein [Alphaproteobacteria bacterium]
MMFRKQPTKQQILKVLEQFLPSFKSPSIDLEAVSGISIEPDKIIVSIAINPQDSQSLASTKLEIERRIKAFFEIKSVNVIWTKHQSGKTSGPQVLSPRDSNLQQIRNIIAVASGKGGVGKSTITINLALALRDLGFKVGILDADIYGPSVPKMMGISGKPTFAGSLIQPMIRYNIKTMSMGYLISEDTPVIWRGPMIQKALQQILYDVDWGELDYLVIDLPPGTGDVQLTLVQKVSLSGAVIVSTPQDIALIDALKGYNMFLKVGVPVLGLVENMSYFRCESCGHHSEIFGHGGARREALAKGVNFLGEIPLDKNICKSSDRGEPMVESHSDTGVSAAYLAIAKKVMEQLQ